MTSVNQLTFFHADINQSEVEDSFQLASDWMKSVRKNVNKSKADTLSGLRFVFCCFGEPMTRLCLWYCYGV